MPESVFVAGALLCGVGDGGVGEPRDKTNTLHIFLDFLLAGQTLHLLMGTGAAPGLWQHNVS